MFTVYRNDMEARSIAEYGPPMDLSSNPVGDVSWLKRENGQRVSQMVLQITPRRDAGSARRAAVRCSPGSPLTATERGKYAIGKSAYGNAIQLRYLREAVESWFFLSPPFTATTL